MHKLKYILPSLGHSRIQRIVVLLVIIAALEGAVITLLIIDRLGTTEYDKNFDSRNVRGVSEFHYQDILTCQVMYTTYTGRSVALPFYEEKQFTLAKLSTDNAELLLQDGKTWGRYRKQYEDEKYVTLQTESSWNSDVLGLDKRTGTFVRTLSGIQGGKMQYAVAQKGRCK